MAISYKKLLHLMIEKDITAPQLQRKAQLSGNVFTRIRRNEYISLESIEAICGVLDCRIDDILDFIATKNTEAKNDDF